MDNLSKSAIWATIAALSAIIGLVITLINKNKGKKEENVETTGEERTVIDEKLIVYNKSHESTGILTELEIGTKYLIYLNSDLGGFYKVRLANAQIGYILKTSKRSKKVEISGQKWTPPSCEDEATFLDRCMQVEFNEIKETRSFRDDPLFNKILEPKNNERHVEAIQATKEAIKKFPDFDLPYYWQGDSYFILGKLSEAKEILSIGLNNAKRKFLLLTKIGEVEWKNGNIDYAVYAWAQVMHNQYENPMDYNAYLLLSYVAEGAGMEEIVEAFRNKVDSMRGGTVRLPIDEATHLKNLSAKKKEAFFAVLTNLRKKYLK
jgi:tetratricopeptide (TPR) repeat protein